MGPKTIIPDELRFAVTRKCDGECRHCYNQSGKDVDKMSANDFIQIINEVHKLNPNLDRITLTGGEPLNEKERVIAISRIAKSLDIRVRLVTRGWELNSEVCKDLKKAGVTRIQIGLDSSGEFKFEDKSQNIWDTFHSWLRGDSLGFNKTADAIKIAISAGLDVSVRYSLCRSNLNDVVKTYQFVSSLGVSKFKFRILFPDGRAKKRLIHELISGVEMANAQHELILASKGNKTIAEMTQPCMYNLPGRVRLSDNGNGFNAYKEACPCGKTAAYIDSNGDVKYCLFDETKMGNVFEGSFLRVWNSTLAKKVRKKRCPLDQSGYGCSSFKLLYSQFNDYNTFISEYIRGVKERSKS